MADQNKRVFKFLDVAYAVRKPTIAEIQKANELRRKTFNDELVAGSLLREQLDQELRKRKLWSDQSEQEYQTLRQEIIDGEYKLASGGIKLSQARELALSMRKKRDQMVQMLGSRSELDQATCEGKADSARFNFLFACCLVYNDSGEPYFKNGLDDYLVNQNDPVAVRGATEFYYLISNSDEVDDKLPENTFLKKFKFVNNRGQLVDKQGRLIDSEGRHIDEDGFYIQWTSDKEYIKVDVNGRPLKDNGDFDVNFTPFLDDDGNPIAEEPPAKEAVVISEPVVEAVKEVEEKVEKTENVEQPVTETKET